MSKNNTNSGKGFLEFITSRKKTLIGLIIIFIGYLWLNPIGTYDNMVINDQSTQKQWGNVQTSYQERNDLIPNLVATVKGYADHEMNTLIGVIEKRSEATSTNIDPSNMSSDQIKTFMDNQGEITSALSKLMVVVEKYPDLKANENFKNLQASLEGIENKIRVERNKYNDKVQIENTYLSTFKNKMLNKLFEFKQKEYFESSEGADEAPVVSFE